MKEIYLFGILLLARYRVESKSSKCKRDRQELRIMFVGAAHLRQPGCERERERALHRLLRRRGEGVPGGPSPRFPRLQRGLLVVVPDGLRGSHAAGPQRERHFVNECVAAFVQLRVLPAADSFVFPVQVQLRVAP